MERRKLLITGSEGLIGKILSKALANDFDVYGIDFQGKSSARHWLVDIADYEALDQAFQKMGKIEYAIHLAADRDPKAAWQSVLKNNIIGTRNLYECARKYGIKRVIFASSNHVTGGYEGIPARLHKEQNPRIISIMDPIRPDSDYGTSKAFGEALAREYFELYGLESICLRIGGVKEDNDPTKRDRLMKTWLSHRDLIQLVQKSIFSKVKFGIYYAVSNNRGRFWDISNAEEELGFKPQDDAALFI